MVKAKALTVLTACFSLFMAQAFADTIYLKNGKSLQGLVTKEDKNAVEINVGGGTVLFHAGEIERIERSTSQETETIKKDWEAEKVLSQKTSERDRVAKEKAAAKWEKMVEEEKYFADKNTKIVPVASEGGHIFVDAVLNGETHASLIIDTGCPNILLTAEVGRELGLDLDKEQATREVMVLDGKHRVRGVLLKSVKLGDVEEKSIMADVLLEDTPRVKKYLKGGLLGMTFLKKYHVSFDQKKMRMTFKPFL